MSQDIAAQRGTSAVVVEETTVVIPVYSLGARLAAEAFGTFLLVLGIVGTATFNVLNQNSILTIALAGGIALMAGVAAVGHVSGGHFNPAVTFGMALAGRMTWRDVLPYWLAQFVGAAVAAVVLWAIIPGTLPPLLQFGDKAEMMQATANGFGEHSPIARLSGGQTEFTFWTALIVEVIIAAIFVGVILATTDRRTKLPYPPVVIGLTLAALHIISWPVTNTSFNPARSFASALFGGGWTWEQFLQLFIWGPLVGAALAALFYRAFAPAEDDVEIEVDDTYVGPAGAVAVETDRTDADADADLDVEPSDMEPASGTVTITETVEESVDTAEPRPTHTTTADDAAVTKPEDPQAPKA